MCIQYVENTRTCARSQRPHVQVCVCVYMCAGVWMCGHVWRSSFSITRSLKAIWFTRHDNVGSTALCIPLHGRVLCLQHRIKFASSFLFTVPLRLWRGRTVIQILLACCSDFWIVSVTGCLHPSSNERLSLRVSVRNCRCNSPLELNFVPLLCLS